MVYSLRHTFITRTAAPSIGCEPKHPPDRNPTLLSRSTFNLQTLKLHRKWTKVQKTSNLLASSYLVMGGGGHPGSSQRGRARRSIDKSTESSIRTWGWTRMGHQRGSRKGIIPGQNMSTTSSELFSLLKNCLQSHKLLKSLILAYRRTF